MIFFLILGKFYDAGLKIPISKVGLVWTFGFESKISTFDLYE